MESKTEKEEKKKKMPKEEEKRRDWLSVAFGLLILVLILKALGILKAYLNIDPNGITLSFDVGFLASAGLFSLLWVWLRSLNDKLSTHGERIAKVEAKLERLEIIEKKIEEISNKISNS